MYENIYFQLTIINIACVTQGLLWDKRLSFYLFTPNDQLCKLTWKRWSAIIRINRIISKNYLLIDS